jgi:hypothetical protein
MNVNMALNGTSTEKLIEKYNSHYFYHLSNFLILSATKIFKVDLL